MRPCSRCKVARLVGDMGWRLVFYAADEEETRYEEQVLCPQCFPEFEGFVVGDRFPVAK